MIEHDDPRFDPRDSSRTASPHGQHVTRDADVIAALRVTGNAPRVIVCPHGERPALRDELPDDIAARVPRYVAKGKPGQPARRYVLIAGGVYAGGGRYAGGRVLRSIHCPLALAKWAASRERAERGLTQPVRVVDPSTMRTVAKS